MSFATSGYVVRVKITRLPPIDRRSAYEIDLRSYEVGSVYDVGPRIAEYLIVMGFAVPEETRQEPADQEFDQAADWKRSRRADPKPDKPKS